MRIVIIGAGGRLGAALLREYRERFEVVGLNHAQLDLGTPEQFGATLDPIKFHALINAAALTDVDYCEGHRDEALQVNAEAPRVLAEICRAKTVRFVHISTDYVFDGEAREPYTEEDVATPISVYGESKREGERRVLEANDQALVARVSWVFGPDRPSFIDAILKRAREEEKVAAVADKFSTPTYAPDIAETLRPLLLESRVSGLLHLANSGECSWQQYAQWALDCCHAAGIPMRARTVEALSLSDMKNFVAKRPVYTVLSNKKCADLIGRAPRDWREAVAEYVRTHVSALRE
jgi:dTDP-4-dehydrorhamnose reductase